MDAKTGERRSGFSWAPAAGGPLWRILAWVLVAGWLVSSVSIVLTADRSGDLSDLTDGVADGTVTRWGSRAA